MKFPSVRTIMVAPLILFILAYIAGAIFLALDDRPVADMQGTASTHGTIAIFGASGTAGDGILKAALADPSIRQIHVVTRRSTPRIEQGIAAGKVDMTVHTDYLDYTDVLDKVADAGTVYWAIGTSSFGVDQETYSKIHVEFPMRFIESWAEVCEVPNRSFHYISSSDISEDSLMMWAREKARAENVLFQFAGKNDIRVIAYRPDYIGPTAEERHLGQAMLFWFFRPVGAAVRARQIGQAMIEVTARGPELENGSKIGTRGIYRYSDAYERRQSAPE